MQRVYTSRSRRRSPKAAATTRFSNTVMPPNGCGTWNERAIPMTQRRGGGTDVISAPSNSTRPASAATVPVMMPNSVVLPAPFGPMMPSASPFPAAQVDAIGNDDGAEAFGDFFRGRGWGGMGGTFRSPARKRGGFIVESADCRDRGWAVPGARSPNLSQRGGSGPRAPSSFLTNEGYDNSSSFPPTGICGAVSFWVMTRSNASPLRCHCPETSGVLLTFFTGWPDQFTGPTIEL